MVKFKCHSQNKAFVASSDIYLERKAGIEKDDSTPLGTTTRFRPFTRQTPTLAPKDRFTPVF